MKWSVLAFTVLATSGVLLMGKAVGENGCGVKDDPDPGTRMRALWTEDGVAALRSRLRLISSAGGLEHRWATLVREELGVSWTTMWKEDRAPAMGVGYFQRHEDGADLMTDLLSDQREAVSKRSFDCFVRDGKQLRRVLSHDHDGKLDVCIVVYLPDRIVLISPEGRIHLCPRKKAPQVD